MKRNFVLHRALAIAKKEVMHIMRDPFTLGLAVVVPLIMVLFFGFAIDFDFRGIKVAVYDQDNSRLSRELVRSFSASEYFKTFAGASAGAPAKEIEEGKATISMVINSGFEREIFSSRNSQAQIIVDGTDNQKTGVVAAYLGGIQRAFSSKLSGSPASDPIKITARFIYNPELNTKWFIVPGLIVIVTGLLSILLTALTVAREWENGSMEMLLSTPVTPFEIVLGKILPYVGLGLTGIVFVYIVARLAFSVPFRGSYLALGAACFLFITTSLAQGLLISVITRQQQKAMQASMVVGLLPPLLLSGFIFPIESMPLFFRYLTMVLPPRWFTAIIRTLFLKGTPFEGLVIPFIALALMAVIFIAAASKRFKRDLEP
ncbi:MAG TPA: ABC transporter permease [Elusimicrobia bacterium]|nr:MAG: multidrug ABC transporter permease [Elusimicrobia bacterium RIFOXYA12_FULL_49_49]OGS15237.1 MAG: multidrug ABC transporter permease [Elusimicrobia bacterium RIFOXYA2_FULL_47_53]OGS25908.1 MAG: multidrug ABC transporter permease [Elusimicrobia bacterium RIFOXYB12_FULL_50_12]OGS30288.1 MAG: multidrug ABC transporter permease [Elusimicrobia bacterium RIFOXYB2_FULL_46_23]HBU70433.1 ABC transporter permease [Elusimicrobiota bacterium]